jgi:hypothetical protein
MKMPVCDFIHLWIWVNTKYDNYFFSPFWREAKIIIKTTNTPNRIDSNRTILVQMELALKILIFMNLH